MVTIFRLFQRITPCVVPVFLLMVISPLTVLLPIFIVFICILLYRQHRLRRQLQQAAVAMRQQSKAQEIMLRNISHEARTPLNAIVGFGEQLSHMLLLPEQQELLSTVDKAASQLMRIMNNVQDLNKLQQGVLQLDKQPFSIYQAFTELMYPLRAQAQVKKLFFDFIYEGDRQLQVNGDRCRFEQIIYNLTENALRYTVEGSVLVKLRVEKNDASNVTLHFSVADTGQGIAPDVLPHIFEYYANERPARHLHTVSGAGIGLAITKGLLQLYNGHITVETVEGEGSKFSCSIPFQVSLAPQTMVITQREVEHMKEHFMEGCYVLVADDQDMNLLLMDKILTRWRCRFDKASDGLTAYKLFCENTYDMVLLDLQMPGMTGVEVVDKIRHCGEPLKANVPVLALTADTTFVIDEKFREAGFDDCLLKPFREKDIYNTILKYLRPVKV